MKTYIPFTALAFNALMFAAPGKLTLDGKTVELTHVYARKAPSIFDSKTLTTYILATDRELPASVRLDDDAIREMGWSGKLNSVQIELNDSGINWSIRSTATKNSLSGSQSPNPYKLTIASGRVTGLVKMEKPHKLGDSNYYFEFPVDAAIETKAVAAAPTTKDKVAAQTSAPAKAYLALQAAIRKGDKAAILKGVDPDRAAKVNTPEFPEMLKMIQAMQAKDIEVLQATETGDTAELAVAGSGKESGTVKMRKLNSNWVVVRESWKQR
jgi:hypothetical protein